MPAEGLAQSTRIADIPDGSIRLLLLDSARSGSAVPWNLLEKKLAPQNGLVVALSPVLAGDALRAQLVIPVPAYLEALDEAPIPCGSPVTTFSVSQPLQSPPVGVTDPADLIAKVAGALSIQLTSGGEECSLAACLKRKTEAIHRSGRGSVFSAQDRKMTEVLAVDSADSLWKLLTEGGCWIDSAPEPQTPTRYSLLGNGADAFKKLAAAADGRLPSNDESKSAYPLVLVPSGLRGALDDVNVSPLMTKLYQESGLRRMVNQADINPETARTLGISNGAGALVETQSGSLRVEVRYDPGVMPGMVHVALGPSGQLKKDGLRDRKNVLAICQNGTEAVWRVARAKVREA